MLDWSFLLRAVDHYCERIGPGQFGEPVNTMSNVAFLLAAWFSWRLRERVSDDTARHLIGLLAILIAIIGIGSTTFHTFANRGTEFLDVIPILVFMGTYLWVLLTYLRDLSVFAKAATVGVYVTTTLLLEVFGSAEILWGGLLYLPSLVVLAGAAAIVLSHNEEAGILFLSAFFTFLASFGFRAIDMAACDPLVPGIGTHFVWHILNAVLLYMLLHALAKVIESRKIARAVKTQGVTL